MLRYIALLWDVQDSQQSAAADRLAMRLAQTDDEWVAILQRPGMSIHCTGSSSWARVHTLPAGSGVIIGTIFRREHYVGTADVDNETVGMRIVASLGRELVEKYWGHYVAFIYESQAKARLVLRAPVGALPCLRTESERVQIYFSHVPDCVRLVRRTFSINWDYLAAHSVSGFADELTGLREMDEVKSGQCVHYDEGGNEFRESYWDLSQFSCLDAFEKEADAAEALRSTVRACVQQWTSCFEAVLLHLSGGLDSSIVLAALSDSPRQPRITCVTEYSAGAESDERIFARAAVHSVNGCKHIERMRKADIDLHDMFLAQPSSTPQNYLRRLEVGPRDAQLAREHMADAVFSGGGGDEIFYQNAMHLTAEDFAHRHPFRVTRLASIAYDAALVESMSFWGVLGRAAHSRVSRKEWDPLNEFSDIQTLVPQATIDKVHADARAKAARTTNSVSMSPGKRWQAFGLEAASVYYDPFEIPGHPVSIEPLRSQPLIELAMQIPTYVLSARGTSRSLARLAFAKDLPDEIIHRRDKGGMEEHTIEIFRRNQVFVRELLLDGMLVNAGLLDPAKVQEALGDHPSGVMKGMAEIVRHLCTEVWLRIWSDTSAAGRRAA